MKTNKQSKMKTNKQSKIKTNKKSGIQYLKSRIHCVESRIKDYLGLPYMGRDEQNTNHETRIAPQMRLAELTLSQFILFYRIIVH